MGLTNKMCVIPPLKDLEGGANGVLTLCSTYFSMNVDVLQLQNLEAKRSMMKYIAELSAKLLPTRQTEGKGLGKVYPELYVEAFKLSLPSSDQIPLVLFYGHEGALSFFPN